MSMNNVYAHDARPKNTDYAVVVREEEEPSSTVNDSEGPDAASLSPFILPIYLPSLFFVVASTLSLPVLPSFVRYSLHCSDAVVGLSLSAVGLGMVVFSLPSAVIVERLGPRRAMTIAVLLRCMSYAGLAVATSVTALLLCRFAEGSAGGLWQVGRQTSVAAAFPQDVRGKGMSALAGVQRMGSVIGPLIGGFVAGRAGARTSFWCQAGIAALTMLFLLRFMPMDEEGWAGDRDDRSAAQGQRLREGSRTARRGFWLLFLEFRSRLFFVGLFSFFLAVTRSGRNLFFPLQGYDAGINEAQVGTIISVGYAVDSALFPVAGWIIDKKGRKASAVPATAIMSVSLLLLPLCSTFTRLCADSALGGLGNGLSAGLIMTIGADLAPEDSRAAFMGIYRTFSDAGQMLGPAVGGMLAHSTSIATGSLCLGGIAFFSSLWGLLVLEETRPISDREEDMEEVQTSRNHLLKLEYRCYSKCGS